LSLASPLSLSPSLSLSFPPTMSLMSKFFGGGSKKPASSVNSNDTTFSALQKVSEQVDMMDKKVEQLNARREKERVEAMKLKKAKASKEKVLPYLRRMQRYQKQIDMLVKQRDNLENMKMTLEVAPMNAGTVTAMKAASGALQSGQMDIDEMAEVMDDARDQMEQFEELNEQLAEPMMPSMGVDDDEIWENFEEEMMNEELGTEEDDLSTVLDAPLPPTTAMPARKKEEVAAADDDEADLASWAM